MSGPPNCFVCFGKFGLFRKQLECKKCHRVACKSCLTFSIQLPEKGSLHHVCKYCYNAAKINSKPSGRISPPANFKRELAKKENAKAQQDSVPDPADELITERLRKLKESYDKKDISVDEIQNRLQKLCASEPNVTMEELEYRLAKLKGSRPPAIRVHSIRKRPSSTEAHCSNDNSERTQVKRLIRQYTDEIAMETGRWAPVDMNADNFHPNDYPMNPSADDLIELARVELRRADEMTAEENLQDEEIKKRLSLITNAPSVPVTDESHGIQSNFYFDADGMDEESARLIQQLLEEDRLDQNLRNTGVPLRPQPKNSFFSSTPENKTAGDAKNEEEELPWCFMCNDDATIRCLTCEDLFCKTCFRVVHQDSDMKKHKTKKFVNPNPDSS